MFLTGVLQSLGIVFISSFFFVYIRMASGLFAIDPVVFTSMSMIATALTLSALAGPGRYVNSTLKSWQTWFYGFMLIGTYILDVVLVAHVSGTETGILNRITIPFTLLLAIVMFSRWPSKATITGTLVMVVGFLILVKFQGVVVWTDIWLPVALLVIANASSTIVAETHKEYEKARKQGTLRDKMRVVAFVSFITACIFLGLAFSLSLLKASLSLETASYLAIVPTMSAYSDTPSIILGTVYGLIFAPAARYLKWASAQNIKAENVLAILALIPLVTLTLETFVSFITEGNIIQVQPEIIWAAVLVSFGASMPILIKFYREHKASGLPLYKHVMQNASGGVDLSIHHSENAVDDYDIICATLEHTDGDTSKASALLNIPETTFLVLLEGEGNLALRASASKEVSRRYRTHVANRDGLTGLLNRSGFLVAMKKSLSDCKKGALFYIDLDKFKPVNDTYGHDAGDAVLVQTAQRLHYALPESALITRMGGDEFCVFVPYVTKSKAIAFKQILEKELLKPYRVDAVKESIQVGASIGLATYPHDGQTPATLISAADKEVVPQIRTVC